MPQRSLVIDSHSTTFKRVGGFTLVELAISLVIISLILGTLMSAGATLMLNQNIKSTQLKLQTIDVALATYVAIQGRLPCPANGTLASSDPTAGVEVRGASAPVCGNQATGVVPWSSIGLSETDVSDAWGRRITYRVAPGALANSSLADDNAVSMTSCDPAGLLPVTPAGLCTSPCVATACTSPTNFLAGKGLSIRLNATTSANLMDPAASPPTGAAYVLISHGQNGSGSYPFGGGAVSSVTDAGDDEKPNRNGVALAAFYIDRTLNENSGNAHYDDIVSRPSLSSLIMKAQRGPRPQL